MFACFPFLLQSFAPNTVPGDLLNLGSNHWGRGMRVQGERGTAISTLQAELF